MRIRFKTKYAPVDAPKVRPVSLALFPEGFGLGGAPRQNSRQAGPRRPWFEQAHFPVTTSGFTLTELAVTLAILGILFGVVLPNILNSRTTAQTEACIANLKAIDAAKHQWATDNRKADTAKPKAGDIYGTALYLKSLPICPADGIYTLRAVNKNPTCSIAEHKL